MNNNDNDKLVYYICCVYGKPEAGSYGPILDIKKTEEEAKQWVREQQSKLRSIQYCGYEEKNYYCCC